MNYRSFLKALCSVLVLCLSFVACEPTNPVNPPTSTSESLYIGVVAFNQGIREFPLTNNLGAVKSFINEQQNDKDFTSFAYAVSKGNMQFGVAGLPKFDNIFMLNFSDGTDNYSNMKWGEEGRMVAPNLVYDAAREDLQKRLGLNSYAIGFGNDVGFGEQMRKVVMGSGSYFNAKSSSDLQPTFNEIATSMLASAKNVLLKTNPGYYSESPKYFRFTFTADGNVVDTIYAQMTGTPKVGYTLSVTKIVNNYAYFDAPARGEVDGESGKVHIPLNNLKFVKNGEELQYKFAIEVSFDGQLYYTDVEEASTEEKVSKRIAVVLVLDCSTSMGDAFEPMKAAAVNFIESMEKMEVDTSEPSIPDVPGTTAGHDWVDLGLSVKWATTNVGASKPEGYGTFYTYEEAQERLWTSPWRTPSRAELEELKDKCTWKWTTQNGVRGCKVTGPNGNSIFLPAAGYLSCNGYVYSVGARGDYWSSTPGDSDSAWNLYLDPSGVSMSSSNRCLGQSVRLVRN